MFDSARAREILLLPRNTRREEEGNVGFFGKTYGQSFLGVSSTVACITKFQRATDLQVSGVSLAGVIHANFQVFSLVISGRFVIRCAERPSTVLTMASAAAPTRQRPPEVRSWHVHRIPKSHIYVQIDFCV